MIWLSFCLSQEYLSPKNEDARMKKIYVGDIALDTDVSTLQKYFRQFGKVKTYFNYHTY